MNLFSWKGRNTRLPYFLTLSLCGIVFYGLLFSIALVPKDVGMTLASVFPIAYLVILYVQVCNVIKRLHDLGRPGVHILFMFVPFYNLYLGLLLLFKEGDYSSSLNYGNSLS